MNNELLTGDVDGRTAKKVRQDAPLRGPRFSPKAKKIAVLGAGVLGAAIVLGVLTAGHHGGTTDAAAGDDHAGMDRPDTAVMLRAAQERAASEAAARQRAQMASAASGVPVPPIDGASGASAARQPDPAQAYDAWLKEQHYKQLEADVATAQGALGADVGIGGMKGAPETSPAPAALAGTTGASGGTGLDMQKALLAQGASGVAVPDPNRAFQKSEAQTASTGGYLPSVSSPALGEHELFAGSVIPAVMETAIDSDLPGTITAQVRRTVYDSRDPSVVLVPQGARLVGTYSSGVQYGQQRVMVVWNELMFPDGATLDLKGMQGTDGQGMAGFSDQVNNHYLRVFGSAVLISLIGAGAQLAQPQNSGALNTPNAAQQATAAMATQMDATAQNLLNKNLGIAPTLTIRPGYEFNVLVQRTVILPEWRS